jgi:ABC-type sugar transport system ATPase subunit
VAANEVLRVSARGISKRYGAVKALTDVTFELRAGEIMALLGENGAGKSTIVKVLSGLIRPDEGVIEIDGVVTDLGSSSASQQAGISVVQQEYSTVGSLSIAENLLLGQRGTAKIWLPKALRENAARSLERVGLGHLDPRTLVEDLSVAEMQLLEIARAVARDAKVVIFDEPTAALSDAEIEQVLLVVKRLAAEGRSIVYVTHRLGEVFQIADRVTIFRNGQSEPPTDVSSLDVDKVITLMLGRELGDMYPEYAAEPGEVTLRVDGLVTPGIAEPVSFTARKGEILGFTGQLGSGASQVLQSLAGLAPVIAGAVTIDGATANLRNRRAGTKTGIAYSSPDRKRNGIFGGTSILRNLSSPWLDRVSTAGIVSFRRERQRALETAETFAIDKSRLRAPVATLSGGNQQKVAVGKWLGIDPTIMLVDEPTRGVDVGARSEIYRRLRELCEQGMTVIVCSSDTNEIYGLCDVIGTFYRGSLSKIRPRAEWTEVEVVREVMQRTEATS